MNYSIARQAGISYRHLSDIRHGRRRPSPNLAILLEKVSGINRLAWIYPDEFFNPEAPYLYRGPWPPDLSHLLGEALERSRRIVADNPDGPPPPPPKRRRTPEEETK